MEGVINWFAERWNAFVDYVWRIVLSIFDMIKDIFFWIIEQVMSLGVYALDGVGSLLNGLNISQYFSFIPPETAAMMSATGFSEAMGMIVTCLGIRFLLQMIPFVRWGS